MRTEALKKLQDGESQKETSSEIFFLKLFVTIRCAEEMWSKPRLARSSAFQRKKKAKAKAKEG